MSEPVPLEKLYRQAAEAMLIAVYVPEAEYLTHEQALDLALVRDMAAAQALRADVTQLDMTAAMLAALQ